MDTQVWLADGSMGQEMRGEGWAKGAEWVSHCRLHFLEFLENSPSFQPLSTEGRI